MKKRFSRHRFKKVVKSRSPWSTLTKTVNQLTRIAHQKKNSLSYLEKAEMARLKRSIGKLKEELKESQKTNLDLAHTIDDLENQLSSAASQLARVFDALKELSASLNSKSSSDQ